ncbi:MAG: hypothetical protein IJ395_09290 [Clostridia bacterium]|nr:hypothetical protein [Clostridia bacterium]
MLIKTNHPNNSFYLFFCPLFDIFAETEIGIEFEYLKQGNYNFYNKIGNEILGYDITTTLGSNINFTQLTATIEMDNNIDIVSQNFGFNLENGNKICELNLNEEYYYLEVKNK